MTGDRPATSARFDRVSRPDPTRARPRPGDGKEALYSTAPTAAPTSQIEIRCRRCDVLTGRSLVGLLALLRPPFLWDPLRDRLWTRCPVCQRYSWLEVRTGQALRVLLHRTPDRR